MFAHRRHQNLTILLFDLHSKSPLPFVLRLIAGTLPPKHATESAFGLMVNSHKRPLWDKANGDNSTPLTVLKKNAEGKDYESRAQEEPDGTHENNQASVESRGRLPLI
jgi:hypothetical protein